jgi:hypothetical protein
VQNPRGVTSLSPRDIAACFRLKLWDLELGRLVPFPGEEEPETSEAGDALT